LKPETKDKEDKLRADFVQGRKDGGTIYQSALEEIASLIRRSVANKISLQVEQDDLVQEVLISIHEARFAFQENKPLLPWVYAIARFRLVDWFRKNKRRSLYEEFSDEMDAVSVSGLEDSLALEQIMETLPEKQKEILGFVKISGHSMKETADEFNMTEGAVKVTVHRAMEKLKSSFGRK